MRSNERIKVVIGVRRRKVITICNSSSNKIMPHKPADHTQALFLGSFLLNYPITTRYHCGTYHEKVPFQQFLYRLAYRYVNLRHFIGEQ